MYQVTVTHQFLSGKDTFRQAVPALSWAVLIFATFILTRPPKVRPKKSNFGGRYFYVKIQL